MSVLEPISEFTSLLGDWPDWSKPDLPQGDLCRDPVTTPVPAHAMRPDFVAQNQKPARAALDAPAGKVGDHD